MKPARSTDSSVSPGLSAPREVIELVRRFEDNFESYKSAAYNETQVRREFVDPLFKALGWDIDNSSGTAEAYKDVIHEDAVRVGSVLKAPDYSFRIGGTRKFFLETKRPSINLKDDIASAFQLRRYGWSAKLPLSILTDFEELAVYDCRIRPNQADKAPTGRISYYTYKDYAAKWGEIAGIFSKESVLKGSFDRYAEGRGGRRGTETVDKAFLEQIDAWRKELAQNLALRNLQLSSKELNAAVQMTLDRIIFLRICEARGIEDYGKLLGSTNGANVYLRLCDAFREADARYNSGLFHFGNERDRGTAHDSLTLALKIDDKILQEIVGGLYYPQSPYEFAVLPADILGSVYERFLGKVIRLTEGHRAKVEEKPEVREAGGVFYTPTYVVDHMVENSVGKLLEGKGPKQAAGLRILDPACGSGSFLIGAYQKLLDWHLAWYTGDGAEKWASGKAATIYKTAGGWRLMAQERKQILLNSIYGVDIDAQAVEVTKLSLLLKVLEGETGDTLARQLQLIHARALPDIEGNIRCGNSLIGFDFFDDELIADEAGRQKINAFDWEKNFPKAFQKGGFDCVIGNPPYGAEFSAKERKHLSEKFDCGSTDSAALMMILAKRLLAPGGVNAFIVPKAYSYSSNWSKVRKAMLEGTEWVVDAGKVWKEVKLEQLIYGFQRSSKLPVYRSSVREHESFKHLVEISKADCQSFDFLLNGIGARELALGKKLASVGSFLDSVVKNTRGAMLQKKVGSRRTGRVVIGGKQIQPFQVEGEKGFLDRTVQVPENASIGENCLLVQNIIAHVERPTDHIKIIAALPPASASNEFFILDTVNQLAVDGRCSAKLILGLLSSRLINWYVYRFIFAKAIRTMHFDGPVTSRIPIPKVLTSPLCSKLVGLVETMLVLRGDKARLKGASEIKSAEDHIAYVQDQIDSAVGGIYGLTPDEVELTNC